MSIRPQSSGTPVQHERSRYGESNRILREGNLEKFLPIVSKQEVLNTTLKESNLNTTENEAIINFFQSVSSEAKTTTQIIQELQKYDEKTRKSVASFFKIVYTDLENQTKSKVLQEGKEEFVLKTNDKEYGLYDNSSFGDNYYTKENKNFRIEDLCEDFNEKASTEIYKQFNYVNKDAKPTKEKPHFSAFMINNPDVRVGLKNSLEMATFLNVVSTLEFSRAYPYFNAYFILPDRVNQNQQKPFKTASMNQFLFGGSLTGDRISQVAKSFESNIIKRRQKFDTSGNQIRNVDQTLTGVEANMSLFTSPQTMINANEQKGHFSNIKAIVGTDYDRKSTPRDTMLPFMTLVSFNIDIAPTRGLMSFKTGTMNLILHDKNRMIDIAPLIKPDLFGAFGAEIVVEYGWSHPDANEEKVINKIGEFIDSSRALEKYMIVNSSFTIDNSGMVNITLSVASKGPVMFKSVEILQTPKYTRYTAISEKINSNIVTAITNIASGLNFGSYSFSPVINDYFDNVDVKEAVIFDINNLTNILDGKDIKITESLKTQMRSFIESFRDIVDKKITFNGLIGSKVKISDSDNLYKLLLRFGFTDIISRPEVFINEETRKQILFLHFQLKLLRDLFSEILEDQKTIKSQSNILLESIIGGGNKIDPYFDKKLASDLKISEIKNHAKEPEYITLGNIITSIIGNYFLNGLNNSIDEVQLVFYTANKYSGRMRRKNLSSILIEVDKLKNLLSEISQTSNLVMTIESLIAKILVGLIRKKDNITYGLKDIYKNESESDDSSDDSEEEIDKKIKQKELRSKEKQILKKIYPENEELNFIIPNIVFSFDSLTKQSDNTYNTTICKITIYDRNDNPFDTLSSFIRKYTDFGKLENVNKKVVKLIRDTRQGRISKKEFNIREKNIIEDAIKSNIIKKPDNDTLGEYEFFPNTDFSDIKHFVRKYMPYTKIGTQNSGIINASLSTINEAKLLTTYVSKPDRNNDLIETRVRTDLPLRVMPSQAQVELFGCPWAQFGQMLFLDFGTETSIDNQYNITGISHELSPGKFTTKLKLSYGDFYGPIENGVNNIIDLINKKLREELDQREVKKEIFYENLKIDPNSYKLEYQNLSVDDAYNEFQKNKGQFKLFLEKIGFVTSDKSENNFVKIEISSDNPNQEPNIPNTTIGFKHTIEFQRKEIVFYDPDNALNFVILMVKYHLAIGEENLIKINYANSHNEPKKISISEDETNLEINIDLDSISTNLFDNTNNKEADVESQKRLDTFYTLSKGYFDKFIIGNGQIIIGPASSNLYGVLHYNGGSGKVKSPVERVINVNHNNLILINEQDELTIAVDKLDRTNKIKGPLKGNFEEWFKEVWSKKEASEKHRYTYLPSAFKKSVGVNVDFDEEIKVKNYTSQAPTDTNISSEQNKQDYEAFNLNVSKTKQGKNNLGPDDVDIPEKYKRVIKDSLTEKRSKVNSKIDEKVFKSFVWFMLKGFQPHQAAGITGHLLSESAFNHQVKRGDGFRARGIGQWRKIRKQNLVEYIFGKKITGWKDNPKDPQMKKIDDFISQTTLQDQLDFVIWEFANSHKKAGELYMKARTLRRAIDIGFAKYGIANRYILGMIKDEEILYKKANEFFKSEENKDLNLSRSNKKTYLRKYRKDPKAFIKEYGVDLKVYLRKVNEFRPSTFEQRKLTFDTNNNRQRLLPMEGEHGVGHRLKNGQKILDYYNQTLKGKLDKISGQVTPSSSSTNLKIKPNLAPPQRNSTGKKNPSPVSVVSMLEETFNLDLPKYLVTDLSTYGKNFNGQYEAFLKLSGFLYTMIFFISKNIKFKIKFNEIKRSQPTYKKIEQSRSNVTQRIYQMSDSMREYVGPIRGVITALNKERNSHELTYEYTFNYRKGEQEKLENYKIDHTNNEFFEELSSEYNDFIFQKVHGEDADKFYIYRYRIYPSLSLVFESGKMKLKPMLSYKRVKMEEDLGQYVGNIDNISVIKDIVIVNDNNDTLETLSGEMLNLYLKKKKKYSQVYINESQNISDVINAIFKENFLSFVNKENSYINTEINKIKNQTIPEEPIEEGSAGYQDDIDSDVGGAEGGGNDF